ncbi:hypothetical protein NDU88_003658 [Pleurodeles waltl]|uniref:Uncharacterized protein n=1 Tax=Pleurodeles waltl TaxID=8319 RepID=A0AAV7QDQ2_PLEWA|nr:hypothetical protein NDU88_003658 [Pleurodeles waltl]
MLWLTSRGRDDITGLQALRCIGMSPTLDLRHSDVSEVRQDQRLQRRKAYWVVGLLRSPRYQGRRRRGSGEAASAHRVVEFALQ